MDQVFYDIALYHTRLDSLTGNDKRGRRTMHEYYARGGTLDVPADPNGEWEAHTRDPTPLLTNWCVGSSISHRSGMTRACVRVAMLDPG